MYILTQILDEISLNSIVFYKGDCWCSCVFLTSRFTLNICAETCVSFFSTELEKSKLLRQYRILDADRQAYSIQARQQMRKQQWEENFISGFFSSSFKWRCVCVERQEIEKLTAEQEELRHKLGAYKSLSRQKKDKRDAESLQVLLEQRDRLEGELEKDMQHQKELQKEVNDSWVSGVLIHLSRVIKQLCKMFPSCLCKHNFDRMVRQSYIIHKHTQKQGKAISKRLAKNYETLSWQSQNLIKVWLLMIGGRGYLSFAICVCVLIDKM